MRVLGLLAVGFVSVPRSEAGCDKSDFYGKTPVVDLCDSHFPDKKSENIWMVEFYAPWCGHCQALKPKFIDAAKTIKKNAEKYAGIKFGAVDCTKEQYLCQKYGVKGYPTLKGIVAGKAKEYQGARETDDMLDFMLRLKDSKGSKGGSARCSSSLASSDKKEIVPLCSSHFPDKKGKNNWVILFHSGDVKASKKAVNSLAELVVAGGAKLGVVDCDKETDFCETKVGKIEKGFSVRAFSKKAKQLSTSGLELESLVDKHADILKFAKQELGDKFKVADTQKEEL